MTAGDKGVVLVVSAGGYDLTGATCTLLAQPKSPADGVGIRLTPMVVADDGLTAAYTTIGTDFTVGGDWEVAIEAVPEAAPSDLFTGEPDNFYIFNRIA